MANNMLWFWAGAGFTWLVLPTIKLFIRRRKEFNYLNQHGSDAKAANAGIARLVHTIKEIDPTEVKTIVISVEGYDAEKSYVGFGGRASNIAHAINVVCEQLALRVPDLGEEE